MEEYRFSFKIIFPIKRMFIQYLESKEFYPFINEDVLSNAIQFAQLHTTIDDKNLRLNMHCRKFLLLFRNETGKT